MNKMLLNRYMDPLVRGQRKDCREIVANALSSGTPARTIYRDLIWPAMHRIDQMYRDDQINLATEHMATRVNRIVADHLQAELQRRESIGKRILITCADGQPEELDAQMAADLFEADGWDVYLVGGGVPDDEVVSLVGQLRPDVTLIVGSKPTDAPPIRGLIDRIHEISACPTMNIMVSGGVFNRAPGLWQEVKADLYAETMTEALEVAAKAKPREPQVKIPGAPKRRRRRRRPALLMQPVGNV